MRAHLMPHDPQQMQRLSMRRHPRQNRAIPHFGLHQVACLMPRQGLCQRIVHARTVTRGTTQGNRLNRRKAKGFTPGP